MELSIQVKEARKQAGLTQGELAERANVGRTDVSRFERGENVTMKTFMRIVGALPDLRNLTIGDLNLQKEGAPIPQEAAPVLREGPSILDDGEMTRRMAASFLRNLADQTSPPQQPPPDGALPRELSLLRTIAQLILELTGGR